MKSLEELSITSSDVSGLFPKIITAIEDAARAARFGRQLVKENRDLVGAKGHTLTVPYRGAASVDFATATRVGIITAEGTMPAGRESKATYTTTEVTVTKIGGFFKLTQEAIDSANIDLIKDQITEMGESLADFEDYMIMDELYAATNFTQYFSASKTGTGSTAYLTYNKILEVVDLREATSTGTLITAYTVDVFTATSALITINQAIAATASIWISYKYSSKSNYAAAIGTQYYTTYEDLVAGRTAIKTRKFNPTIAVIDPYQEAYLLKDSRFIDASQYGGREPILNGEIGKAAGLKILTCLHAYEGAILFIDPARAAWLVIKRDIDMKLKEIPEEDSFAYYFYQELKPKVINEDALWCVATDISHV